MTCVKKITDDLLFDCEDAPKKGLDGGKAVLVNIDDIDRSASVVVGATISDLVLKAGTRGCAVEWYKDLASGNSAFTPSTEDIDGFLHNFLTRLANSSAASAERANELKNGRFVMVYETKYKGVLQAEAFKVAGWENGLLLSEMVTNTAENSGAPLFTLTTEEGDVEKYPYSIFLETDYATSKATFDSLFSPAIALEVNYTDTQFVFKFKLPSTESVTIHWGDGTSEDVTGQDSTLITKSSAYVGAGTYSFYITGDVLEINYIDISGQAFVSGVAGKTKLSTETNFAPASAAADNVTAFNGVGSLETFIINEAGTFEIDNTLWLDTDTRYYFTPASTVKKETGSTFSHVFGNRGMLTDEADSYIYFLGAGLRIEVNGIDTWSLTDTGISPVPRLRAQFQLYKVSNFVIDNFYVDDVGTQQYTLCICGCTFGAINTINFTGNKDGLDIISCSDITVTDYTNETNDDAIFIGGAAFTVSVPFMASCERITIDGVTMADFTPTGGFLARIYHASWDDWGSGVSYPENGICVNNGRIYANAAVGSNVAANAPVHTSGNVLGADGLDWWYVQDGTLKAVNVDEVTIKNVQCDSLRTCIRPYYSYAAAGTEDNSYIDNITLDNFSFIAGYDKNFITNVGNVRDLTVKNTTLTIAASRSLYISSFSSGKVNIDNLFIDTCVIDATAGTLLSHGADPEITFGNIIGVDSAFTELTVGAALLPVYAQAMATQGNQFTRCDFDVERLMQPFADNITNKLTLIDCEFIGAALDYVYSNTRTGCVIDFVSTGTTYYDPGEELWFNNQATSAFSIDVSDSIGSISPGKGTGGGEVTIIQCDVCS